MKGDETLVALIEPTVPRSWVSHHGATAPAPCPTRGEAVGDEARNGERAVVGSRAAVITVTAVGTRSRAGRLNTWVLTSAGGRAADRLRSR
jgi:hypothetical protein